MCVLKVLVGTRQSEVRELSDGLRAVNVCLGGRLSAAAICDRLLWRETAFRSRSETAQIALTCDIPRPGLGS